MARIYVIPTDTCLGIGCRLDDQEGYEKIYDLKGRDKKKPMAILVPTWEDLAYESKLTPSQVNFLRTYKFPFTIICEVQEDFLDEYPILEKYGYSKVGFRVAETCLDPETAAYIRFPLFLTSGNKSGEKECNTSDEIKSVFPHDLAILKFLPGQSKSQPPSNVIQFVGTTNELKYIRKNYPRT